MNQDHGADCACPVAPKIILCILLPVLLILMKIPGVKIIYDNEDTAELVKLALAAEQKRLELGLTKTNKELSKFEERYHVSSETFLSRFAAEDLEGGDEEYVQWAGELQLRDRIIQRLEKLEDVEYVSH